MKKAVPPKNRLRNLKASLRKRGHDRSDFARLDERLRVMLGGGSEPCHYCNQEVTIANASLDHAIPVSRNGEAKWTNIVVCCAPCNRAKGDLTDMEYVGLLKFLYSLGPEAFKSVTRRLRMAAYRFFR